MIQDLINNNLYGEFILLFIIIAYLFVRLYGRRIQKNKGRSNFDYYVYTELIYYYKDLGYYSPELRAEEELKNITRRRKTECNINKVSKGK